MLQLDGMVYSHYLDPVGDWVADTVPIIHDGTSVLHTLPAVQQW